MNVITETPTPESAAKASLDEVLAMLKAPSTSNVVSVNFGDNDNDEGDEYESSEPDPDNHDYWEPVDDHGMIRPQLAEIYGEENIDYVLGHGWFRRVVDPVVETREVSGSLDRKALADALGKAVKVIEKRNTIPILSNALLQAENECLAIEGTDLDIAVRITIPYEGSNFSTTLPAHLLQSIVKRKKAERLAIAFSETATSMPNGDILTEIEAVNLSLDRSNVSLSPLPAADYPILETNRFDASFVISAESLCEAFKAVEFAISTEETRYYLNGVFLHAYSRLGQTNVRMVATDGHRLAHFDIKNVPMIGDMPTNFGTYQGVIVPRKAVATALSHLGKANDPVRVEISDTKIRFTCNDIRITSKLIDGTFPDYNRVIPENDKTLTVEAGAFVEAVQTVLAIADDRKSVRLSVESDRMTLSVHNPNCGTASEEIDCRYEADAMDIGFSGRYLLDIMSKIVPPKAKDYPVTFNLANPGSPTLIESDFGPTCVLMPMRV